MVYDSRMLASEEKLYRPPGIVDAITICGDSGTFIAVVGTVVGFSDVLLDTLEGYIHRGKVLRSLMSHKKWSFSA